MPASGDSTASTADATSAPGRPSRLPGFPAARVLPTLAVFVLFVAYVAVRTPVPAANEAHYLSKAKNFWNPQWCRGDFFLESADAHWAFYLLTGPLTAVFSLPVTAWIGRILALAPLAIGWTMLARRIFGDHTPTARWAGLWSATVFMLLHAIGNFSGEWVLGGVESKVFSYGFLFMALAWSLDRAWKRTALALGLAISLHPVVGIWGLAALMFAVGAVWLRDRRGTEPGIDRETPPLRISRADLLLSYVILVITAAPGMVPAVQMLLSGGDPEIVRQGNTIQVHYRLVHHLDPMDFSLRAYLGYGALLVFWLVGRRWTGERLRSSVFAWFVLGATLIAVAGLVVGFHRPTTPERPIPFEMPLFHLRTSLMKFYAFRLFDIMLPVAVSLLTVDLLIRWQTERARQRGTDGSVSLGLPAGLSAACMVAALLLPSIDANPSRMGPVELARWQEACGFIRREVPQEVEFLTPQRSWAFKWYAQRPEYVTRKDCPQDAAGIVEWNRRLRELWVWSREHYQQGYPAEALRELIRATGITHAIADADDRYPLPPLFANESFAVYRLTDLLEAGESRPANE